MSWCDICGEDTEVYYVYPRYDMGPDVCIHCGTSWANGIDPNEILGPVLPKK